MNRIASTSFSAVVRAAAGLLLVCATARADCVDGQRQPVAGEAEFHRRAIAALVAALPPAPAGVEAPGTQYDFRRLPSLGLLCKEQKEGAFNLVAGRNYVLRWSEEERRRLSAESQALSGKIDALERVPPEKVAQREALERQAQAAWAAYEAAEKSGDKVGAQRRAAEFRSLRDQASAIDTAHLDSVRPQVEALRKQRDAIPVAGQQVRVGVAMNVATLPPAGAAFPAGAYGAPSPGRSAGLKVYNVVWSVTGTEGPLRQALADAIDKPRLQSLVGNPLPAESASEAAAMQAAAAVRGAPAASNAPAVAPAASAPASAAPAIPSATTAAQPAENPAAASAPSVAAPQPQVPTQPAVTVVPQALAPAGNAAAETARRAGEAVNMFRGLFGR